MARTVAEGTAMVDAARRAGRVLDVAFNKRRRGDIQQAAEVVAAGRLGSPYYAKTVAARPRHPDAGSWFTSAEPAGGGPLLDIGVHVLDYALFVLGAAVKTVSASTYDLLGTSGWSARRGRTRPACRRRGGFDVEDLATVFLPRRWRHAAAGGPASDEGPRGRYRGDRPAPGQEPSTMATDGRSRCLR